jgi:hypothetical protein
MKLLKVFSPISFAILIIALFMVFGAGCEDLGLNDEPVVETKKEVKLGIPMLDITEPGLTATINEEQLRIVGETDQEKVYIMNAPFDAPGGTFDAIILMDPGVHDVPISAGNGLTTTTISLKITRK